MADKPKLTPELHREQIEKFVAARPAYVTYAESLRRALEQACRVSFPGAFVQARAKTVSSFAEKVARKFEKYQDSVNQMTDLCGARVIVQTVEQVRAVRHFIESNFRIEESDDKGLLLNRDEFGYRDMHYIVRLKLDRAGALGFTEAERQAIGDKRAEIQVRTWLQHAWADTLHDHMNTGRPDRDYTAFATRGEMETEIEVERVILRNEPNDRKKPGLSLKLARLLSAVGDYGGVVEAPSKYTESCDAAERRQLLLELGDALCRLHRDRPASAEYGQGRRYLAGVAGEEHVARECFREAHEHEPAHPYYLAEMLGFELPFAYFTAGRLSLLLAQGGNEALAHYARGIRHCLEGGYCVPAGILEDEAAWIRGAWFGVKPPPAAQRALDLLALGTKAGASGGGAASMALPVLIVAGGADGMAPELAAKIRPVLKHACERFQGTVISGGTKSGVAGAMGDAAAETAGRQYRLIGYRPARLPDGLAHEGYDEQRTTPGDFSADQILAYWRDLFAARVKAEDVLVLGVGGGELSALEYRIALSFGAPLGLVAGSGGSAAKLMADPLWSGTPHLYELPFDPATVRAFVMPADHDLDPAAQEEMARTFRRANLEQAHYSVAILEAAGFEVRKAETPAILGDFTDEEVEQMAELEHGRWNLERLRDGWRPGPRNDARKRHDCLVSWQELPDSIRKYDREAVRAFPEILAKAGLEVMRRRRD